MGVVEISGISNEIQDEKLPKNRMLGGVWVASRFMCC